MLNFEHAFEFLTKSFSHNFRTPLTVIKGFTEILLNSENLEKIQYDELKLILKNTTRLEHLLAKTESEMSELILLFLHQFIIN